MKTQFDKIYVISLITNKDRQEFIKYQMNDLGLDFEFIYGIDFYNLKYDRFNNEIIYPSLVDFDFLNNDKMYGCTLMHYYAILQAYELGYNNILIIEDDMCFNKDKNLLEKYLNNIPNNIDFITYTARFLEKNEIDLFCNSLKNKINNYIELDNNYKSLCGTGMYALMNRNTMKLYLDNQREKFYTADHVQGFFENPTIIRYTTFDAIVLDQFNLLKQNTYNEFDNNVFLCYKQKNIVNDYNDFYYPSQFNLSNINMLMKDKKLNN